MQTQQTDLIKAKNVRCHTQTFNKIDDASSKALQLANTVIHKVYFAFERELLCPEIQSTWPEYFHSGV